MYILVYSLTSLFYHLQSNFGVAPRYPFLEAVLLALVAVVVSETVFAPTLAAAVRIMVTVEPVMSSVPAALLSLQFLRFLMYLNLQLAAAAMSAFAITLSNAVLNMVTVELVTITAPAILSL